MTEKNVNDYITYQNFAIAFAKNSLSHSLIDDYYFRKAINYDNTLTKSKLREFIISEREILNKNTLNMLCLNKQPITIAMDGWTNVRGNKVTNILLICSGISYYFTSIEHEFVFNTADVLVPILSDKIKYLLEMGIQIVALTTDNENLMQLVRQELNKLYPILIIIPCSAHIIQLCFKYICHNETIKNIIDETMELIKLVHNDKVNRLKLLELQKNDDIANQLNIIYPTEIRWISLVLCINECKLRKSINVCYLFSHMII